MNLPHPHGLLSRSVVVTATVALFMPAGHPVAQGLALEEIVVTAQRREQSLQDVPLSVETFTGDDIQLQGFENMHELSNFAPGLVVNETSELSGLTIRGSGTMTKNLSQERGAPIFVDGVYFGRGSSARGAYFDVERIEVLRGPQPVHFGQNALAGAVSITHRRPGPEWEGNALAELGSNVRRRVEVGAGGPVSDTLGLRVAARYDAQEGFLRDWLTGERFPKQKTVAGRIVLEWDPAENFNAFAKMDYLDRNEGGRPTAVGPDIGFGTEYEDCIHGEGEAMILCGHPDANRPTLAEMGMTVGEIGRLGIKAGPLWLDPPDNWHSRRARDGNYNMTHLHEHTPVVARTDVGPFLGMEEYTPQVAADETYLPAAFEQEARFESEYFTRPWHTMLEMNYTLPSDIVLTSLTAYQNQNFDYTRMAGGVILSGTQRYRSDDFDQFSQEIRLTSPLGGAFEWMAGGYWQRLDGNITSDVWRSGARSQIRAQRSAETSTWMSGFITGTYNFFDDRVSLDLGGRFTHVEKDGESINYIAEFIVEHPVTGELGYLPFRSDIEDDYPELQGAHIVSRTPIRAISQVEDSISENVFNPQVVLRWRPSDDISLYAKYAEAFKAGGFDTGVAHAATEHEVYVFGPESAYIFEAGMRGSFFGGRAQASVTAFYSIFDNMQYSGTIFGDNQQDLLHANVTVNIGKQRSAGIEFGGRMAVTENLTMDVSGAVFEGRVVSFPGAPCTDLEVDVGLCDDNGLIDRSGQRLLNSPDWQGTIKADYRRPLLGWLEGRVNVAYMFSDDMIPGRTWDMDTLIDRHHDMNLTLGVGNQQGTWQVSLYARNLMANKPVYHPDNLPSGATGDGIREVVLSPSNFTTYGLALKFTY